MPTALQRLDDRVLGDRGRRRPAEEGAGSGDSPGSGNPTSSDPTGSAPTRGATTTDTRPVRTADDRDVDRPPRRRRSASAGARGVLSVVYRISRLVFLLLALLMLIGIGFTLLPTNAENTIVMNVLELADRAAGPFLAVFTQADPERQTVVNYGFAAAVYLIAATLIRKLPLPDGRK